MKDKYFDAMNQIDQKNIAFNNMQQHFEDLIQAAKDDFDKSANRIDALEKSMQLQKTSFEDKDLKTKKEFADIIKEKDKEIEAFIREAEENVKFKNERIKL